MKKKGVLIKIGIHVSIWLLLFFLNFLFLKNYSVLFDYFIHITTWLIYALIFYVTYYFLMRYFLKKEMIIFLSLSFLLLFSAFYIRDYSTKKYHDYLISKNIPVWERAPFPRERPPRHGRIKKALERSRIINNSYGLLMFYLVGFSLRLIQKWQDDDKQKIKLEKEKVSTELSFLKQQINPHFLFNSLNSIYSLSISKSDEAPDTILKLSSILRYVLYDSEKSLVYLKDELKITQDYVELQQLRLTEKVKIIYKVEGLPGNFKVEPLLLIPIIENAFKYGIDNVKESFINIEIKINNQKLELKVSNRIVTKPDKNKKDTGIGIKNIRRRLDLLHPDNYELDIKEENETFSVRLLINLTP